MVIRHAFRQSQPTQRCSHCSRNLTLGRLSSLTLTRSRFCPTAAYSTQTPAATFSPAGRHFPTVAEAGSAIHRSALVPDRFRRLYDRLWKVSADAAPYVNPGRLQLALAGLEGPSVVNRIAVLSSQAAIQDARKLVHLLLVDPISAEQEWEPVVQDRHGRSTDDRNLLIRYGQSAIAATRSTQENIRLRTVLASSRRLQKENLEVLLVGLNADLTAGRAEATTPVDPTDTILTPTLQTALSQAGSVTHQRYPVHKTIVVLADIDELAGYASLFGPTAAVDRRLVKVVVMAKTGAKSGNDGGIVLADLDRCAAEVERTRASLGNAVGFEKAWAASVMPALTNWVVHGCGASDRRAVLSLARSVLDQTARTIDREESDEVKVAASAQMPLRQKLELDDKIVEWSDRAHAEVQTGGQQRPGKQTGDHKVIQLRDSPAWRKLSWWKLFWRVDDVPVLLSSLLTQTFLPQAEKEFVYLSGRIDQASSSSTYSLPTLISSSRKAVHQTTVPAMTSRAQNLVIQTSGTSFASAALGVLCYLPASGLNLTVVEAASVAGLGIVIALKRMQSQWEASRLKWLQLVQAEAIDAVKAEVKRLRPVDRQSNILRDSDSLPGTWADRREERQQARAAVASARLQVGQQQP